ncbi:hypothetical protein Tco_1307803 [Tanacetum coccineum]
MLGMVVPSHKEVNLGPKGHKGAGNVSLGGTRRNRRQEKSAEGEAGGRRSRLQGKLTTGEAGGRISQWHREKPAAGEFSDHPMLAVVGPTGGYWSGLCKNDKKKSCRSFS